MPEHLLQPDRNDFAPRIGFAYQLTGSGKTVLRGGWGLNYWTLPLITLQSPTRQNAPFNFTRSQVGYPRETAGLFRTAPPYVLGGSTPAFSDTAVSIAAPVGISPFDPYMKDSMAQTWNLTLQQEILPQTSLQLSYVGTRGSELQFNEPVNTAYPQSLYPLLSDAARRADPVFRRREHVEDRRLVTKPPVPGGSDAQCEQGCYLPGLLRAGEDPQYLRADHGQAPALSRSSATAEAVLPDLEQRLELEKGDSAYYPRHRFTFNFLIDLPWGPGQRLAGSDQGSPRERSSRDGRSPPSAPTVPGCFSRPIETGGESLMATCPTTNAH